MGSGQPPAPTATGNRPGPSLPAVGPDIAAPAVPGPSTLTGAGPAGPEFNGSDPGAPGTTRPGGPTGREPLGPAGTATESPGSRAGEHEHPAGRPARLVPAGVPLPTGTAAPARTAGDERSSPDYLHAPNEDLTATEPMVPPVLGEYTEAERTERADPGGGSH